MWGYVYNPRWKKFFVWLEFRITLIFMTYFCHLLPESWEILRIYAPSGYIHEVECGPVTGHVIKLLFCSQLTFFTHISQYLLWWPFFRHPPHFYPPRNFLPPSINFLPPKKFSPPYKFPPLTFSPLHKNFLYHPHFFKPPKIFFIPPP